VVVPVVLIIQEDRHVLLRLRGVLFLGVNVLQAHQHV
jgi:hypothetical protein